MDISLLLGGFGGQGVQTIGKLLTYGCNEAGKYVTFYPQYGGAMRGGASNCTVVCSDEEIASPARFKCDYVIAMSIPALQIFRGRIAPGGTLVINSSVITEVPEIKDVNVIAIPANQIAEECGSLKVLNVVMVGFFAEMSGMVPTDIMKNVVMEKMGKKKQYLEMNNKAFDMGVEFAKAQKK